jgi:hypothetical protein
MNLSIVFFWAVVFSFAVQSIEATEFFLVWISSGTARGMDGIGALDGLCEQDELAIEPRAIINRGSGLDAENYFPNDAIYLNTRGDVLVDFPDSYNSGSLLFPSQGPPGSGTWVWTGVNEYCGTGDTGSGIPWSNQDGEGTFGMPSHSNWLVEYTDGCQHSYYVYCIGKLNATQTTGTTGTTGTTTGVVTSGTGTGTTSGTGKD